VTATTGLALFAIPGAGLAVGGVVLDLVAPLCESHVLHLIDLQRVYDDPPDFAFGTIAPITPSARTKVDASSCDAAAGDERGTCRRAAKAATRYLGKVQRVGDVAEALRITVERASAAVQAGDERALKKQLRAAGKREKQLDAALATRGRFGAKLASALNDAGVTASLTEAQFSDAAEIVLTKLAAGGLPETEARTVLGPALTPLALDPLALLGQP
jgi:hypothetical protein